MKGSFSGSFNGNFNGSLSAATNGATIPGLIASQSPINPILNINTFESANEFADTNWFTNIFGVNIGNAPTNYQLTNLVCYCSESWVSNQILMLTRTGWRDLGFRLITLGDGQYLPTRDTNGNLQANPGFFPHGFPWLVNYCHSNGFYLSSYISMGDTTCCGCPGSGYPLLGLGAQPDRIAKDIYWNYTNGFDGLYLDNCGPAFANNTNNIAPIIRQALREANEAVLSAIPVSGNDYSERHPFYVAGPTASDNLNSVIYTALPYDMINGSSTLGISPTETGISGGGWGSGISGDTISAEGYFKYSWAIAPYHAAFLAGRALNGAIYPGDFSDFWSIGFAMIPSQLETARLGTYNTYIQNGLLISVMTNQAMVTAHLAFSNSLAKIYSRPLGGVTGPVGISNVVCAINLNTTTPQVITVSNSMMNLPYYQPMVAYDVLNHLLLTNYYGSFSVSVPNTNKVLIYCFPWDVLNNPYTNPPPAAFYPPNSRVQWCSNTPGSGSGNVYVLRNDKTPNNVWVSTNLFETAPAPFYDITTNNQYRVDYDVARSGFGRGDKIFPLYDFGLNGFALNPGNNGLQPPTGTNDPNFFHGKTGAMFSGSNNVANQTWATGIGTNSITYSQPLLLMFQMDMESAVQPAVPFPILFDSFTGSEVRAFGDGTGNLWFFAGTQIGPVQLPTGNTPRVIAFYFNGASSFIATNNPVNGFPTNALAGNTGANNMTGFILGQSQSGVQNWVGQISRCMIFTNASTFIATAAYTNAFLTLFNQ